MSQAVVTRFAPSPTGRLHLGHAHAALVAWRQARSTGGRFLLRIEDIDQSRCRAEFTDGILEDLTWLGLDWDGRVRRQSQHMDDYRAALDRLARRQLLYPCFCTRSHIGAEILRSGAAPHGPDGPLYPGTCRSLSLAEREERQAAGHPFAIRLDAARAASMLGALSWHDRERGTQALDPKRFGDVVLARKETPTSYHLAVTLDDAIQGVSLVTRGLDLFEATHVHRLLQALLGLPTPAYFHHRLLTDRDGRRFAKRDRAPTLAQLRLDGHDPAAVRRMAGFD
ncbi:MAG: tRNA glutamyl-Q(34) synthetase GluQRS [Proteobacteria bacterium]|nr:tRNA glutamyl-Q(34) synthetase GluQRS [Pseudomonadota bacterium]MBI3499419.1 tRNA glutamyl-Q(34) synthetase GluQRS [Pseudomonadota bacterium]